MAELDVKDQFAGLVAVIREQMVKLDGLTDKLALVEISVCTLEKVKPALVDLALWMPRMDLAVDAFQVDLGG
jgi:hypothetical protein